MRSVWISIQGRTLILAAVTMTLLAGCRREVPLVERSTVIGHSVEGRPIEAVVHGTGPDTILIMATIHGNENAGTPLVHKLDSVLHRRPDLLTGRKVVIVPVVNPDGFARNIRTNARGIDLNRNFAASNREINKRYGVTELSEPESRIIVALLQEYKPDRIVSIHQPLQVIDHDGPGLDLARHMGRYSDLPVKRLGSRPGSLGSYAGEDLRIPIITYELPKEATGRPTEELWQQYGRALLAAVVFPHPVLIDVTDGGAGTTVLAILLALLIIAGLMSLMIWESGRPKPHQ